MTPEDHMTSEDHRDLTDAFQRISEVHRRYAPPALRGASVKAACLAVLRATSGTLRAEDVYQRAKALGYVTRSQTPAKTFEAEMARSIQNSEMLFERPAPGL